MKEIIYHATATVARRVTFAAEQGINKDNVLGVIDKTTGKVIYTPLKYTKLSMSQAASPNPDGTRNYTLYFDDAVFPPVAIGDRLFIKLYSDSDSGDAAEQVKDFFGIVKDGDTVKVVTEDGGEEVVEPVGLMDEDDVYDYLEDIAVLMGGITAQQAASITAATRAIIHGGSGSGEGGEGGSGSGSGE